MWVIFCNETGVEVDSIWDDRDARALVKRLTEESVMGYTYSKRWEPER